LAATTQLLSRLEQAPAGFVVPVVFPQVTTEKDLAPSVDAGVIDQVLGTALIRISSGEIQNRYVVACNLTADMRFTVDAVLSHRSDDIGRRLACVGEINYTAATVLGGVEDNTRRVYDLARTEGEITARRLVEADLSSSVASASNRLTAMNRLGLLHRSSEEVLPGGGRQYVFVPVQ